MEDKEQEHEIETSTKEDMEKGNLKDPDTSNSAYRALGSDHSIEDGDVDKLNKAKSTKKLNKNNASMGSPSEQGQGQGEGQDTTVPFTSSSPSSSSSSRDGFVNNDDNDVSPYRLPPASSGFEAGTVGQSPTHKKSTFVNSVTQIGRRKSQGAGYMDDMESVMRVQEVDEEDKDRVRDSPYLSQALALGHLQNHTEEFLHLNPVRVAVLGILAGSFITFGAALSVSISVGENLASGPQKLLQAIGFWAGFGLVIISGTALYTEVNVTFPLYIIMRWQFRDKRESVARVFGLWCLVYVSNAIGSLLTATLIHGGRVFDDKQLKLLSEISNAKVNVYFTDPSVGGWFSVLLSAVLGNWMVGMAAFNAVIPRGHDLVSKLVSILVPIISFVVLGLQHSPANMGYLHLALIAGSSESSLEISWHSAWFWNIIPASIGNLLGALIFVATSFYFVFVAQTPPNRTRITWDPLEGGAENQV